MWDDWGTTDVAWDGTPVYTQEAPAGASPVPAGSNQQSGNSWWDGLLTTVNQGVAGYMQVELYGAKREIDARADRLRMQNAAPQLLYDQYGRVITPGGQTVGISPMLLLGGLAIVAVLALR